MVRQVADCVVRRVRRLRMTGLKGCNDYCMILRLVYSNAIALSRGSGQDFDEPLARKTLSLLEARDD